MLKLSQPTATGSGGLLYSSPPFYYWSNFMDQPIIGLLAQVPLVGIFIWFVITLTKAERDERHALAIAAAEERTARDKAAAEERQKRDAEWRIFLNDQRDAYNSSTARLAEEIKVNSQTLAAVLSLMTSHDQRVQHALPEMQAIAKEITKQLPPRKE